MSSPNTAILLESVEGPVATLTLNRPSSYNALSLDLLDALIEALNRIASDSRIKVVVIAGAGRAFCAGHDLKQMRANDSRDYQQTLFSRCSEMMQKIRALPQPVIAKVQGGATAAGCQLVATCDLAITVDDVRFAVSGVNLGLFCSTPAVALSRNVTPKRALGMLLTGDAIDATTALDYGLVNQVVARDDLDGAVDTMARRIAEKPAAVLRLGKQMFYEQLGKPIEEAYCVATDAIVDNMMLDEAREGIDAFIEKRPPNWKD